MFGTACQKIFSTFGSNLVYILPRLTPSAHVAMKIFGFNVFFRNPAPQEGGEALFGCFFRTLALQEVEVT
jgi:hypothetical protein